MRQLRFQRLSGWVALLACGVVMGCNGPSKGDSPPVAANPPPPPAVLPPQPGAPHDNPPASPVPDPSFLPVPVTGPTPVTAPGPVVVPAPVSVPSAAAVPPPVLTPSPWVTVPAPVLPVPPTVPVTSLPIDPAKALGLRVVAEGVAISSVLNPDADVAEPNIPDPTADPRIPATAEESTAEGKEIIVHRKLFLPDPGSSDPLPQKRYYLVWPDSSLGSPVSIATYSHRVLLGQNKVLGDLRPHQVWHDTLRRRWFIPLGEFARNIDHYGEEELSLADTQLVTLHLGLENGLGAEIQIKFQLSGPFPTCQLLPASPAAMGSPSEMIHSTANSGVVVYRESLQNTTSQDYILWLRTGAGGPLSRFKMTQFMSSSEYVAHPDQAPTQNLKQYKSAADLEIRSVVGVHADGSVEKQNLVPGEWVSFRVRPTENFILEWRATPIVESVACALPSPQSLTFNWENRVVVPLWGGSSVQVLQKHSQSFETHPYWAGARIDGNWEREVRLVRSFTSKQQATLEAVANDSAIPAEFRVLSKQKLDTSLSSGDGLDLQATDFACQGIFKE
jgi:hypothetical protein